MPNKEKSSKKQRAHKESKHTHGAGGKLRVPLTDVQKVNMGGGMLVSRGQDTRKAQITVDKYQKADTKRKKAAKQLHDALREESRSDSSV